MQRHFLLIEDDSNIVDFMEVVLQREHYNFTSVGTGMETLMLLQEETIDFILLDLGLPDIDGMELLKIIRKRMNTPIIVISARKDEQDKVQALDLGADDYVTKPFSTNELFARIRTALRHKETAAFSSSPILVNKELTIDFEKKILYKNQNEIHLTKNEYRIMAVMFKNLGKVVTYDTLTSEVWGPFAADAQTLRVNISNIRKKIETNTLQPEYLITEIGVGYRLREYPAELSE